MSNVATWSKHLLRRDWCAYCGRKLTPAVSSIDHIHPRSAGGGNHWYNYAGVCRSCNTNKGSMTLLESLLKGVGQPLGKAKARRLQNMARHNRFQIPAVAVLDTFELGILPDNWYDPLATLGYTRGQNPLEIEEYRGLGAKERKMKRLANRTNV